MFDLIFQITVSLAVLVALVYIWHRAFQSQAEQKLIDLLKELYVYEKDRTDACASCGFLDSSVYHVIRGEYTMSWYLGDALEWHVYKNGEHVVSIRSKNHKESMCPRKADRFSFKTKLGLPEASNLKYLLIPR
jgi:hypothetical protein